MACCIICGRKETCARPLLTASKICSDSTTNLNNNNYILSCESDSTDNICDDESIIYINVNGKNISLTEDSVIEIETTPHLDVNANFKDALLASLYSQVDFLKNELEEKNLLIRTLIIQESQAYDATTINNSVEINNGSNFTSNISQDDTRSESSVSLDDLPAPDDLPASDDLPVPDDLPNSDDKDISDNLMCQLKHIGQDKHKRYISDKERTLTATNVLCPPNKTVICSYGQISFTEEIKINNNNNNINYNNNKNNNNTNDNNNNTWPDNTILITGDSMLNQLDEKRLSNSVNRCVKVQSFPGATIEDMYSYITPLLKKVPKHIIIHIGTNNAVYNSSDTILDEIVKLKGYIQSQLPDAMVILSCPITRTDNGKARLTVKHIMRKIKTLNVYYMSHDNISDCLGVKGLHLNPKGTGRLAVNLISQMWKL